MSWQKLEGSFSLKIKVFQLGSGILMLSSFLLPAEPQCALSAKGRKLRL